MANFGTSSRINIGGESLKALQGLKISPVENSTLYATPPSPNNSEPSVAMTAYVNKFRDFAFQKISPPEFGYEDTCIAKVTGIPANEPDYISDTHFIALMRAIDDMLQHRYKGTIIGGYNNPGPTVV